MLKKIATGLVALALMSSTAVSAEVYKRNTGQWTISGHVGNGDASCVLSTYWGNGAQINVNIFPRYDGSQYTTMTITNPNWRPVNAHMNEPFLADIIFVGRAIGTVRLTGEFQIYGSRKVILRNLSGAFSDYFIAAREMIIFPGTADEMVVGLRGTRNASYALTDCINKVLQ